MINERFTNPFPGLRPFESTEDHLFFGRDGQSDELLRRLRRSRFLAVLGTSGSGKSSLVRAGMLPSLYGGLMTQAGSGWRVALFRPGHDPIGNLAAALSDPHVFETGADESALQKTITEATLRRSALGLVEAIRQARMPANENLLVVVDQFEEIFRFRRTAKREGPEDEAAAFIKLLLEAKRQTDVPIYIVITMRSDFLGDCAQFRDLPEAINDGQYLIPRMTRDQRREAITGPVAVGGGEISGRLVNQLLNDVGDNPDHLPILQHALMRTWDLWMRDRRNGEAIDIRHYEAIGTMADALSRHADEAYGELPDDRSRALAEKLFKSLTEKGPDNREIRRPTTVAELSAIAEASPAEMMAVIEPFRRAGRTFLMPPASVALNEESLIDISHESLIRGWERLRQWVDEEGRSAQIYRRLAETAALHGEGHAGLWHDPDLALALRWRDVNKPNAAWATHCNPGFDTRYLGLPALAAERYGQRYNPDFEQAMAFIDASKTANEAEIAERERQRRLQVRRTRIFASVLGVAFLISLLFGVFAFDARNKAYAAHNEAFAARNEALGEKKKADDARAEAEKEKVNAQESEKRAVASEQVAQAEKDRAEEAALIAEQRRRDAQAATARAIQAQVIANDQREAAKREATRAFRAEIGAQTASTRLNIAKYDTLTLEERLIRLSSPGEAAYWRNYYATALAEIGRSDLSKAESSKVLETFSDNVNALTNRGYMSLIRFETTEALKDFERVRELDPQYSLNYLNLAVTQANLKDYSGASNSIQKAIDWYRPGFFDGVFDSEVSDDIKQATHRTVIYADGNAFNAALYYERAALEAFRGGRDFESRLKEADENALRTDTSVEGYLTALNWAWMQRRKQAGDYGAWAIEAHLWRMAGYENWARYGYSKFYCSHKELKDPRYDDLSRWASRQFPAPAKNPVQLDCSALQPPQAASHPRMKLLEAGGLANIGQYSQAVELLNPEIERRPDDIDLLLARARYRRSAGYWAGVWKDEEAKQKYFAAAREDFLKILKLSDQFPSYKPVVYLWWSFYGPELGTLSDNDKRFYLEKALEMGPANPSALTELSNVIAPTDPAKAIELLKRSLAFDSSHSTYYKLAVLQNSLGKHKDALESIKLAIALQYDEPEYYVQRERAEEGLGVSLIERKRHLSAGYAEIADSELKQGKLVEAYQNYRKGIAALSLVANIDQAGGVAADVVILKEKLARVTENNLERTSSRIISVQDGTGATRVVTVDRGREDGYAVGEEGTLWSHYSKAGDQVRRVQKIGQAKVTAVDLRTATIEVTMDDPQGDKLVRANDLVEVRARIPPLADRSVLWRLAKFHINFTSENGDKTFVDYRKLYHDENGQVVNAILDEMAAEITRLGEQIKTADFMDKVIKSGRFKDKTLRQVMANPQRADLLAFFQEVWTYPATYYGKDVKVASSFGDWVLGEPK